MPEPAVAEPAVQQPELAPLKSGNGVRTKSTPKIPALDSMLKAGQVTEDTVPAPPPVQPEQQEYSLQQLKSAWLEYAEKRKLFKAEFQLLSQEIEIRESTVVVHLLNPVQETFLNDLKTDLTQHLRMALSNHSIHIESELKADDSRKVVYTNREKFDHLAEKNPLLSVLKERLGLDTDF